MDPNTSWFHKPGEFLLISPRPSQIVMNIDGGFDQKWMCRNLSGLRADFFIHLLTALLEQRWKAKIEAGICFKFAPSELFRQERRGCMWRHVNILTVWWLWWVCLREGFKDSVRNNQSYFAVIPAEGENHTCMTNQNAGCISLRHRYEAKIHGDTLVSLCRCVSRLGKRHRRERWERSDCTHDRMSVRKA